MLRASSEICNFIYHHVLTCVLSFSFFLSLSHNLFLFFFNIEVKFCSGQIRQNKSDKKYKNNYEIKFKNYKKIQYVCTYTWFVYAQVMWIRIDLCIFLINGAMN